jgi:HEAT repeat protein
MGKLEAELQKAIANSNEPRSSREADIELLSSHGMTTRKSLYRAVNDAELEVNLRQAACWALSQVGGSQSVRVLTRALKDPESHVSFEAAKALIALNRKESIPTLQKTLSEGAKPHNRSAAAYALGFMGDRKAVPNLIKTLQGDEDAEVRSHAAEALGYLADRRALRGLIAHLTDESAEVRFWSAFALGEIGDPGACAALERVAATDKTNLPKLGRVSREARNAIKRITEMSGQ